jgi:hypothetical protein
MTMHITPEFPQHKNKRNGEGRREGDLAAELKRWLVDLDASEALKREQLRQVAQLRSGIYRLAKARGVSPTMLRAARRLMRK